MWTSFALVVLVGLVETVLWLFAPAGKRVSHRYEFDNQLPGVEERVSFMVDGRSLRTWKGTSDGEGRELRVLVLGGAATTGLLQNDPDTWWGRLGATLQEKLPASRVQVSALFRDHTTILHGAKWAEAHLAEVKPDVLVAAYGFEDVIGQHGAYTYEADRLAKVSLEANPRGPVKEFLVDVSQICRRMVNRGQRRGLTATLGPLGERNAYARRLLQQRQLYATLPLKYEIERPAGRDPLAEYLDGLRALAATAAANGAALVVIGEPALHRGVMDGGAERLVHRWFIEDPARGDAGVVRLDSGWIELELARYHGEAERLCSSLGVPFLDPTRKLPAHPALFLDDTMLTDGGARALAGLVAPTVQPLVEARLKAGPGRP